MRRTAVVSTLVAISIAAHAALPRASAAIDLFDGRLQIHGSVEEQLRGMSMDWKRSPDLSMWRTQLGIEGELGLLDTKIGPLDELSAFVRLDVSYDCVWTHACGIFKNANAYGDHTGKVPSKYTNGRRNGYVGDALVGPSTPYAPGGTDHLLGLGEVPPFEILAPNVSFNQAFAPLLSHRFAVHQLAVTTSGGDSSGADAIVLPWRPKDRIDSNGSLASVTNVTNPVGGLPFRPSLLGTVNGSGQQAGGLYAPSPALRELIAENQDFSHFDQNFSQNELAWNLGASQETWWFLREAYLDASLLEGQLSVRLGRQTIIWGKTELFRNTDQINPVDLAVSTLPSLEESRIPQWALRAIYSLYDIGPLQDVRLELVWMLGNFEPTDIGRCGEPYSPLPVCSKTSQLFVHGALGAGLVGETRPPSWWNSWQGNEVGARVEFRWERFSFAITDFWHWEDSAHPRVIQRFERRVDPSSGRPLNNGAADDASCVTGAEGGCLKPGDTGAGNALTDNPQNRQLFDVICASSVGFFALSPTDCALTLTNAQAQPLPGVTVSRAIGTILAGSPFGEAVYVGLTGQAADLTELPSTPAVDGPFIFATLDSVLTNAQEALLGCGPFYGTNCSQNGLDIFNAEASVVFQTWPSVRAGSPVATRYLNGQLVTIAGARGFLDPAWNPAQDGCPGPTAQLIAAGANPAKAAACAGTPDTGIISLGYTSEMQALSANALSLIVGLDLNEPDPAFPNCSLQSPLDCPTVQDFMSVTATTRPDMRAGGNGRFGRRDFTWAGAGELLLEYDKVNTLGFAMDFAEDVTETNWGVELTWTANKTFANSETLDRLDTSDRYALTLSVDRPTFVHFLNDNKTFFFNMQWFFEYLPEYVGGRSNQRGFEVNGPWTALGTFTAQTGYFQDRLQPALTVVYDVQSASGAVVLQTTFRYTANLSITFGMDNFFGRPQGWYNSIAFGAFGESNQTWRRERFDRLNAVRERDDFFMRLRYTF